MRTLRAGRRSALTATTVLAGFLVAGAAASGAVAAEPLKEDAIIAPKALQLFWRDREKETIARFAIKNTASTPVTFNEPIVLSFAAGNGEYGANGSPGIRKRGCPAMPLPAGGLCAYDLVMPAQLLPGEYTVKLAVTGTGGEVATKDVTVKVKAEWFWAFLVYVVGAGGGWFVAYWRGRGRGALRQLARLARLRESIETSLRRIRVKDPLAPAARTLRRDLDAAETAVRGGADRTAAIDALERRRDLLEDVLETAARIATLDQPMRELVQPRLTALADAYAENGEEAPAAKLRLLLDELRGLGQLTVELDRARDFARIRDVAARGATDAGAAASPLPPIAFDKKFDIIVAPLDANNAADTVAARRDAAATLATDIEVEAKTALDGWDAALVEKIAALEISEPVQKPTLEELRKTIEAARAIPSADRAAKLAAVASGVVSRPAAQPAAMRLQSAAQSAATATSATAGTKSPPTAPFAIDLDGDWIILPARGIPAQTIENRAKLLDVVTNLFALGLIGLAGVAAQWSPNPIWGSAADIITALLVAAAARAVIGETPGAAPRT